MGIGLKYKNREIIFLSSLPNFFQTFHHDFVIWKSFHKIERCHICTPFFWDEKDNNHEKSHAKNKPCYRTLGGRDKEREKGQEFTKEIIKYWMWHFKSENKDDRFYG